MKPSTPRFTAFVALLACACSAGSDDTAGRGSGASGFGNDGEAGPGASAPGAFSNSDGTTMDALGKPPIEDSEVDLSLIWIANSEEGTVSKINTRTLVELGRYRTSPNSNGFPSRTSVGLSGNMVVANRGTSNRHPGVFGDTGVTKIMARKANCEDRNGNGTIETSTGGSDVLPWMEDECIMWYRPLPHTSTRPVQWGLPSVDGGEAPVWTAGSSDCMPDNCTFDVWVLDGTTGDIIRTIPLVSPSGQAFSANIEHFGPYGAAVDAGGHAWFLIANTTHLVRVDAVTFEVLMWPTPMANGYGITVDSTGRIHICGAQGVSRFDPSTASWETSNPLTMFTMNPSPNPANMTWGGGLMLGYNGCMTDGKGTLWVAGGADSGTPGLHGFDTDTLGNIDSFTVGNVKGVSIDVDGYLWGVGSTGMSGDEMWGKYAWRVDIATREVKTFDGLNGAYSYSDMTGFALKQAGVKPVLVE